MRDISKFFIKIALFFGILFAIIGGVLRIFFMTPVVVNHNGMAPTIYSGETVFMWRGGEPKLGSIVLCRATATGEAVIARVIGTPNVNLSDDEGQLVVEGRRPQKDIHELVQFFNVDTGQHESARRATVEFGNTEHDIFIRDHFRFRLPATVVSAGKLYLLGDNRGDMEHDSRTFGQVDISSCQGTLIMRGAPIDAGLELGHGWLDLL